MRTLIFNHPSRKYKPFGGRYLVSSKGRVFKISGKELNYHIDTHKSTKGARFVRLSGGKSRILSITVARLILLTFKPEGYKKRGVEQRAIHKDGIKSNDKLKNLIWGDNSKQGKVMMKNPKYKKRVSGMSRKFHNKKKKK